ncbi:MAG: hypothetical protein ACFE8B_01505 [Candidatus Hermodarchaeota archaeon]
MNWSIWEDIENLPDYEGKGVYKVRIVSYKEKSISIQRFLDEDKDGIIMIGKADNIKKRLKQFNKIVTERKKYPHSEGLTIHLLRKIPKFKEKYGTCTFQYTFSKVGEPTEEEKKLLESYFIYYGELPPLNYKREFISSKKIRELHF